jgi:hypothetical protein
MDDPFPWDFFCYLQEMSIKVAIIVSHFHNIGFAVLDRNIWKSSAWLGLSPLCEKIDKAKVCDKISNSTLKD